MNEFAARASMSPALPGHEQCRAEMQSHNIESGKHRALGVVARFIAHCVKLQGVTSSKLFRPKLPRSVRCSQGVRDGRRRRWSETRRRLRPGQRRAADSIEESPQGGCVDHRRWGVATSAALRVRIFAAECDDWVAPRAAFLVKPLDLEDCESVGSLGPPQRLPHDDSRVLGGAPQVRILFGNPLGLEGFEPSRLAIGRLGGDRHRDSRSGAG